MQTTIRSIHSAIVTALLSAMLTNMCLAGESETAKNDARLAKLRELAKSDPTTDFVAAKKKGDIKFLAMMGYAKVVPGVPDYDQKYAKHIGTKLIIGTTDAITSSEQRKVQDAVQIYAAKYNRLVIDHWTKQRRKSDG